MGFAVIFPGQGSQSVGMLSELAETHDLVTETFAEASAELGYDLWQLVQQGPEEQLNQTPVTQPAMLAGGVAVWRVWQKTGGAMPDYMAGHSLGEYTALVCAGSLAYSDAVRLVAERGRLMQEAVAADAGAMAAVLGLKDAQVAEACAAVAKTAYVAPANYNAPGQVVVAGERAGVSALVAYLQQQGGCKVKMLPVSVPSHCRLMAPAAQHFAALLDEVTLQMPAVPIIQNVDARSHSDLGAMRQALAQQLHQPVRWSETIQWLLDHGVDQLAECGPGKVLNGLVKRISRHTPVVSWQQAGAIEQSLARVA